MTTPHQKPLQHKIKSATASLALALTISSTSLSFAHADEGQWQPHQLPELTTLFNKIHLEIPAPHLADLNRYPLNAVVGLGYCSASFVSPQGLVVTNHHCAYGAIQNNSTAENNLMDNGFLAKTLTQELPAGPQERLYITEEVTDVTDKVRAGITEDMKGQAYFKAISNNKKQLIAACETDASIRCQLKAFHHGLSYFLIKQLQIQDVRLVYAPPQSVGNFGGDIDNFEYPRHTGDFSFFRAYVAKDGSSAPYSADNVPFQPKSFLRINPNGVKAGDGVIVAGFPGRTSRYKLPSEVAFAEQWAYPNQIKMYEKSLDVIETAATTDTAKVAYASTVKSINNRLKKRYGLKDGFRISNLLALKQEKHAEFMDWLTKNNNTQALSDIKALEALLASERRFDKQNFYFTYATKSDLFKAAMTLYKLAKARTLPDAERDLGYQQRDEAILKARLKRMQRRFDSDVDKALWSHYLAEYLAQPKAVHNKALLEALDLSSTTSMKRIERKLKRWYKKTKLDNLDKRLAWFDKSVEEFENSRDPFIKLAVTLYDTLETQENEEKSFAGEFARLRPAYMQALISYNRFLNKPVYPDANGTLRVTLGQVDGYPANDGTFKTPFTSLTGLTAKYTGEDPFQAPAPLLKAVQNSRSSEFFKGDLSGKYPVQSSNLFQVKSFNNVPVNFLSSADTTGGNSGSPVMNAKGELVGLNFDSTYESISKDWYFNADITRAIHVDIRYILWLMAEVDGADNLLKEMQIKRAQ